MLGVSFFVFANTFNKKIKKIEDFQIFGIKFPFFFQSWYMCKYVIEIIKNYRKGRVIMTEKKHEIIIFDNQNVKLEVNVKDETVWLNLEQM